MSQWPIIYHRNHIKSLREHLENLHGKDIVTLLREEYEWAKFQWCKGKGGYCNFDESQEEYASTHSHYNGWDVMCNYVLDHHRDQYYVFRSLIITKWPPVQYGIKTKHYGLIIDTKFDGERSGGITHTLERSISTASLRTSTAQPCCVLYLSVSGSNRRRCVTHGHRE